MDLACQGCQLWDVCLPAHQQQRLKHLLSLGRNVLPVTSAVQRTSLPQQTPPATSHPSTHSIMGCQNNPHTSSQQSAEVNQAGSIALGLSPMRQHLPRTSLCHNTGVMSSYLKPTLPPEGRWRVSLPQVAVSHRCHSPFNEQPVLWLQGGGLLPSDTCWKARNH